MNKNHKQLEPYQNDLDGKVISNTAALGQYGFRFKKTEDLTRYIFTIISLSDGVEVETTIKLSIGKNNECRIKLNLSDLPDEWWSDFENKQDREYNSFLKDLDYL